MATGGSPSQRRRTRARRGWVEPAVVDNTDDDVVIADQRTTCIDLTTDTSIEEVIDLTHSHGIMDSPVVVLTPADDIGPVRHRRGRGRLGRRRSGNSGGPSRAAGSNANRRSRTSPSTNVHEVSSNSDSDSDELPEMPFTVPPQNTASNSLLQSPEPVKVSCPICLDDLKQIRHTHRQVISTNCGHIFCDECIKTAIDTQHACPTCRKKLTKKSFHPLFL
ncbi:E3 ubiquitin-protein ligase RNF4 isoform X2 [Aplysia californica]|uniref:E3 ubiquitin-protein ligase RNF4 isoform X2 n=1 Tax=Aplysia californica TaxID=6500 RepID=A0ABM0JIZ8_APLCA|nr:E3 ubiquitin-protein ligase RNF4 isoform X2 [Aplysia californica]